jgi:type I restriction enzyme S subunit
MSFPRYPEYKDSGVEWLGEVPRHWKVTRLKNVASINMGQSPSSDDCTQEEIGLPFLQGNADFGEICPLPRSYCAVANKLANVNDILLSVRAPVGAINIADQTYGIGRGLCAITAQSEHSMRFVFHALQVMKSELFAVATGSTYEAVSTNQVGNATFLAPPHPEQKQIVAFLDRETAKIDALVAEQRRLMELLKEKRQAVISHAVTRGLNPNAPLKPSGIDWLGDVPAHWKVLPLKRIVSVPITDGPHETPNFIDEGVPFVSAEAVSTGSINFSKVRACISEEDNARYSLKYAPKLHDIYMVKSGATTGVTAIVEDRTDFNIWSPLAAIRCNQGSVPHFVLNFMRSKHFQEAVTLNWSFGTQQNIGMGVIENLACTVPPLAEQHAIAQILKSEAAKFDTLTTEAQRAIDLLQERRTALISAAVTGQIDVRGLAPMESP